MMAVLVVVLMVKLDGSVAVKTRRLSFTGGGVPVGGSLSNKSDLGLLNEIKGSNPNRTLQWRASREKLRFCFTVKTV